MMEPLKLHIVSDVHLEFGKWPRALSLSAIDCDVHIFAGDIGVGLSGLRWALERCTRPVVTVMGNHEFYGRRTVDRLWREARALVAGTHVHLLENEAVTIGDVRFVGASLWTDFGLNGYLRQDQMMRDASDLMNDYARIRVGRQGRRWVPLSPRTTLLWHERSVAFLDAVLPAERVGAAADPAAVATVVVTHHAPSARSLGKGPPFSATETAYASGLEDLIVRADLWVHGHTHVRCDYLVDDGRGHATRVVSNPRGYVGIEPVRAFDPRWVIDAPLPRGVP